MTSPEPQYAVLVQPVGHHFRGNRLTYPAGKYPVLTQEQVAPAAAAR